VSQCKPLSGKPGAWFSNCAGAAPFDRRGRCGRQAPSCVAGAAILALLRGIRGQPRHALFCGRRIALSAGNSKGIGRMVRASCAPPTPSIGAHTSRSGASPPPKCSGCSTAIGHTPTPGAGARESQTLRRAARCTSIAEVGRDHALSTHHATGFAAAAQVAHAVAGRRAHLGTGGHELRPRAPGRCL
jgi:hypothetical protein